MGSVHEDQYKFLIISRSFFFRLRNISDKFIEEIKTHILYSVAFFFFFWRLSDNMEIIVE
jgi:hypothetical protein